MFFFLTVEDIFDHHREFTSPALAGGFFTTSTTWEVQKIQVSEKKKKRKIIHNHSIQFVDFENH